MRPPLDVNHLFVRGAIKADRADRFVGREELIGRTLDAIGTRDSATILYGERGVGKTSLAWQAATILEGTNPRFKRTALMSVGAQEKFVPVFFKCNDSMKTVEDVLVGLIRPSLDKYSISSRYPNVYQDEAFVTDIKRKYGFNLMSLAKVDLEFSDRSEGPIVDRAGVAPLLSRDQTVHALFDDVLEAAKKKNSDEQLIIFLDELERVASRNGFGSLLKKTNFARFVFVGIADDVSELIADHESVARELMGNDIEVPVLSDHGVRSIFGGAEQLAGGELRFDSSFVELAVKYSGGFPYLAQQFGFHAVKLAIAQRPRRGDTLISDRDFPIVVDVVTRVFMKEVSKHDRLSKATDSITKESVLEVLWAADHPLTQNEIQQRVDQAQARFVASALERLRDEGFLTLVRNYVWRFADPITRILLRYQLDQSKNS